MNHYRDNYCRNCDTRRSNRRSGTNDRNFNQDPNPDGRKRDRDHRSNNYNARDPYHYHSDRDLDRYDRGHRRRNGDSSSNTTDGHYGPKSDRRSRKSRREDDKNFMSKQWPPPFDSNEAAYIFDVRSGFFYEGASDFFYDPKNKLYYGNKKKAYFRHVPGASPEYVAIEHPSQQQQQQQQQNATSSSTLLSPTDLNAMTLLNSSGTSTTVDANPSLSTKSSMDPTKHGNPASQPTSSINNNNSINIALGKSENKMKIAISIKKKKVGSVVNNLPSVPIDPAATIAAIQNSNNNPNPTPSLTQKKHSADINKWAERGREIRNTVDSTLATAAAKDGDSTIDPTTIGALSNHPTSSNDFISSVSCINMASKPFLKTIIGKTIHGKPACLLCKRKFINMEKLKQHLKLSVLHKRNLSKKEAASAAATKAALYRDRAQERRFMYEPELSPVPNTINNGGNQESDVIMGLSLTQARTVTNTELVNPSENLGGSNIGNQMLQKLGWKTGGSMGRKENESMETNGNGSNNGPEIDEGNGKSANDKLKEDWEKIESLAGSGGIGHTTTIHRY